MQTVAKKKLKYKTPAIRVKKVKISLFMTSRRMFDSYDEAFLFVPKAFASSCLCCFLPQTKVLMGNGTTKNIEDIKKGDIVLTRDLKTNQLEKEKVLDLVTHYGFPNGYLIINNSLKITGNHPVWSDNRWQRISSLHTGEKLSGSTSDKLKITVIDKVEGSHDVYNLVLAGKNHCYFADGILVHNGPNKC